MNHAFTESTGQFKKILNELQKYKTENKKLKQELIRIKTEQKFKSQLLDEKSKHIISCIAENISLRKEIGSLKNRLKLSQKNNYKNKKQQQLPLIVQDKQLSFDKSTHDNSGHAQHYEYDQMPYLILPDMLKSSSTTSRSSTSNMSAQACKLSFPCTPPCTVPCIIDESKNVSDSVSIPTINTSNTILKSIAESNENSPIFTTIVNESNNNQHIHIQEWTNSVATILPQHTRNEMSDLSNISYVTDEEDSVLSMHGHGWNSDYHQQEQDVDHLTLTSTNESRGDTADLVFVDYSSRHLSQDSSRRLSDMDEMFMPIPTNIAECNEFPKAISVLSELTDVENDGYDSD